MTQAIQTGEHFPGSALDLPLEERAEILDRARWAREFQRSQIEALARYVEIRALEKGSLIFKEGSKKAYMGLVLNGRIAVFKEDIKRKNKVIATLGPGMTFGEMSLIDGEPRSASAVAASDAFVALLTEEGFERLMDDFPRLGLKLLMKLAKLMSQRLRETSGRLIDHLS